MKYKLENIEVWDYNVSIYPSQLLIPKFKKFLNSFYSLNQFDDLEQKLIKTLKVDYNQKLISSMNPLYPEWGVTTITLDVTSNLNWSDNILTEPIHKDYLNSQWYIAIKNLVLARKKLLKSYFNSGNKDLSRKNEFGILFSNDSDLRNLENSICLHLNTHAQEILSILEYSFDLILIESLLWIKRSDNLLNFFYQKLSNGNEDEKNIILLSLSATINVLNLAQKQHLFNLIQGNLLYLPSPYIRNKSVSLLSELIPLLKGEIIVSNELKQFINNLSESTQYNYSIPAKEIKKNLFG